MVRIRLNSSNKRVELFFERKPPEDILKELHGMGWRWHNENKCWYKRETAESREWALRLRDKLNAPLKSNPKPAGQDNQAAVSVSQEVVEKTFLSAKTEAVFSSPKGSPLQPSSTILAANLCTLERDRRKISLLIVADEHQQDATRKVYWVGRALPTMVLSAIQNRDRSFVYKGVKYQVTEFTPFKDADKYLKIVSRFSNPTAPQTVYVFAQKSIVRSEKYELVTAMIPCADRPCPVPVSVYYDKEKNQYFINEATYTNIRKSYGLPYLKLQIEMPQGATQWFSVLKPHSELNLLGYNVSASEGLSIDRRRRILRDAINSGALWKGDIINHLEWLIHMGSRNPNMENAVGEWRSDLEYISQYSATEQRKIWIKKFKSKFSEVKML